MDEMDDLDTLLDSMEAQQPIRTQPPPPPPPSYGQQTYTLLTHASTIPSTWQVADEDGGMNCRADDVTATAAGTAAKFRRRPQRIGTVSAWFVDQFSPPSVPHGQAGSDPPVSCTQETVIRPSVTVIPADPPQQPSNGERLARLSAALAALPTYDPERIDREFQAASQLDEEIAPPPPPPPPPAEPDSPSPEPKDTSGRRFRLSDLALDDSSSSSHDSPPSSAPLSPLPIGDLHPTHHLSSHSPRLLSCSPVADELSSQLVDDIFHSALTAAVCTPPQQTQTTSATRQKEPPKQAELQSDQLPSNYETIQRQSLPAETMVVEAVVEVRPAMVEEEEKEVSLEPQLSVESLGAAAWGMGASSRPVGFGTPVSREEEMNEAQLSSYLEEVEEEEIPHPTLLSRSSSSSSGKRVRFIDQHPPSSEPSPEQADDESSGVFAEPPESVSSAPGDFQCLELPSGPPAAIVQEALTGFHDGIGGNPTPTEQQDTSPAPVVEEVRESEAVPGTKVGPELDVEPETSVVPELTEVVPEKEVVRDAEVVPTEEADLAAAATEEATTPQLQEMELDEAPRTTPPSSPSAQQPHQVTADTTSEEEQPVAESGEPQDQPMEVPETEAGAVGGTEAGADDGAETGAVGGTEAEGDSGERESVRPSVVASTHVFGPTLESFRLTESELQLGKAKPAWIPDGDAPTCMLCQAKFTPFNRRHHCRACGRVLCGSCCGGKAALPYLVAESGGKEKTARVCEPCSQTLVRIAEYEREAAAAEDAQLAYALGFGAGTSGSEQAQSAAQRGLLRPPDAAHSGRRVTFGDGVRPGEASSSTDEQPREPPQPGTDAAVAESPATPPVAPPTTSGASRRRPGNRPGSRGGSSGSSRRQSRAAAAAAAESESFLTGAMGALPGAMSGALPEGDESGLDWPLVLAEGLRTRGSPEKLVAQMSDAEAPPVEFAIKRNLTANVKLLKLDCCTGQEVWAVSSVGLRCVAQDEVLVLLERREGENRPPFDLLRLFNSLYEEALQGNRVTEMDHIVVGAISGLHFGPSGFLGSQDHAGLLFIRPSLQCLAGGIPAPDKPFLVGLLLLRSEIPWAKILPIRLLFRLGAASKVYPCPLVSLRERAPLYEETGQRQTIMNLLADFRNYSYCLPWIQGSKVRLEEAKTTLCLPKSKLRMVWLYWRETGMAWQS